MKSHGKINAYTDQ